MDIFKSLNFRFNPYFEENGSGGGAEPSGNEPNPTGGSNEPTEKTFTQEQVNSMMAAEKRKQSSAAYKAMGFESEEAAKSFVDKYKKLEEESKTELQKAQDRAAELEANQRLQAESNQNLQYQLDAIKAGCPVGAVQDIVLLAKAKMNDDTDFSAAIESVKKQYPALFESSNNSGNNGTGSGGTPPRGRLDTNNIAGIGERLAKEKAKQAGIKYED